MNRCHSLVDDLVPVGLDELLVNLEAGLAGRVVGAVAVLAAERTKGVMLRRGWVSSSPDSVPKPLLVLANPKASPMHCLSPVLDLC